MALGKLKKADLLAAAEHYGVDVDETSTNAELVASLYEEGVTDEVYAKDFENEPAENTVTTKDAAPKKEAGGEPTLTEEDLAENNEDAIAEPVVEDFRGKRYLIKMERKNPLFEIGKHRFTQDRPFAVVSAKEAQEILTKYEGFRQAFPDEAESFYS